MSSNALPELLALRLNCHPGYTWIATANTTNITYPCFIIVNLAVIVF